MWNSPDWQGLHWHVSLWPLPWLNSAGGQSSHQIRGLRKKRGNTEFLDWFLCFFIVCDLNLMEKANFLTVDTMITKWIAAELKEELRTEIWQSQGQPWSLIWKKYIKEVKQTAQSQLCPVNSSKMCIEHQPPILVLYRMELQTSDLISHLRQPKLTTNIRQWFSRHLTSGNKSSNPREMRNKWCKPYHCP